MTTNSQLFESGRFDNQIIESYLFMAVDLSQEDYSRSKIADKIADWEHYDQNAIADWFDPEWMFGVTQGFDIVLGNPPYVQLQNNSGALAKLYEPCRYVTFARTGDIYCLFYEQGYNLLKNVGLVCFITSNKWMRAGYGENIRKFFIENTNPD